MTQFLNQNNPLNMSSWNCSGSVYLIPSPGSQSQADFISPPTFNPVVNTMIGSFNVFSILMVELLY
jgi:hypothetical protein